jgi:hypothetical protein
MKKRISTALVAVAVTMLALAVPASAEAGVKRLAKQECKVERATEPAEFSALYGGTGGAALKRCVKHEVREARADCRGERAEEPSEFAIEYGGTGRDAIKRCMRDELR